MRGSLRCERLLSSGCEVICLDNYFTGSRDNILHLLDNPHFEVIRHDITFPLYLEVDEIFNLACPASPIHYQFDPVRTVKTSVHGAINMLGLAKRVKAKIFQASTSEVYGDPAVHPQREEYWGNVNAIGPRACYDEGKRCAETLFFDYRRQYGINIRVVRIFNTYGLRMHGFLYSKVRKATWPRPESAEIRRLREFSFPDLNLRFQDDVWRWNADRITAAFDEFQRELIVENTWASLTAARKRGRRGRRPPVLDKEGIRVAEAMLRDTMNGLGQFPRRRVC
jgi:nucleoside-diphosphate-sugar epimerase